MKMIMHEEIPEAQPGSSAMQPFAFGIIRRLTVLDESVLNSTGCSLICTQCLLLFPVSGDTSCVYLNHLSVFTFLSQLSTNKPRQLHGRWWLESTGQLWGCVTWGHQRSEKLYYRLLKRRGNLPNSILELINLVHRINIDGGGGRNEWWVLICKLQLPCCQLRPQVFAGGALG